MNGHLVARPPGLDPSGPSRRTRQVRLWGTDALALVLLVAVALSDFRTGYEIRLSVLYLLPIALVTWWRGRGAGLVMVGLATACWMASFHASNNSSRFFYFVWEAIAMAIAFAVVVELLARLRTALARSDARFLRVLEELFDGVYVTDRAGERMLFANKRFAAILDDDPVRLPVAAVARRFALKELAPAADRGSAPAPFVMGEARDATSGRWYLVQRGPIGWVGDSAATLCVLTDISKHKEAELAQRRLEEAAHHTSRLAGIGEVAATLTHEINQPLTAISTYLNAFVRQIDADRLDFAELREGMTECRDQSLRAGRIVNRMRDFIRRRRIEPQVFDMREAIAEAVKLTHADAMAAGVTVDVELERLRSADLRGDRVMLVQVLVNLVQNAIDALRNVAGERRRVAIRIANPADGTIRVSVEDTGDGVPTTVRERLFEPFCTTKEGGVGLGLSICRTVIQAHAGTLWYEALDLPSPGTAFRFDLPGVRT